MVSLQILSKILATQDNSIVEDNLLTEEYFTGYADEFNFIQEHIKQYGNVPDTATFLSKFPEIELVEVTETDRYLVETVREEYLYYKTVPVIQKAAELLKTDSNAASEYLINEMKTLQPNYNLGGIDIIREAYLRFEEFLQRKEHQAKWFFTTGFKELDDLIHGLQRGEELLVVYARVNMGKSWILERICSHIWQIGYNVGYVSPEMGATSVGYRFDTLVNHFSNSALMWGKDDVSEEDYKKYIDDLKAKENKFIVATPIDFDKRITVSKIRNWVNQYKLDAVAIDGITYMSDERYRRGDNKTTSLTNISEDLMELSIELGIPILVVVQANRTGVVEKGKADAPELESIRDSDGISHNASTVIAINQREYGVLDMVVKKQRFGVVGGKLTYNWDINVGDFTWVPTLDDATEDSVKEEGIKKLKHKYKDASDVF